MLRSGLLSRVLPTRPGAPAVGAWLSLVEHLVRDQGVGGSNPLAPTIPFLFQSLLNGAIRDSTGARPATPASVSRRRLAELAV